MFNRYSSMDFAQRSSRLAAGRQRFLRPTVCCCTCWILVSLQLPRPSRFTSRRQSWNCAYEWLSDFAEPGDDRDPHRFGRGCHHSEAERRTELIVIRTHGRTGIDHFLNGSAERVVRHPGCRFSSNMNGDRSRDRGRLNGPAQALAIHHSSVRPLTQPTSCRSATAAATESPRCTINTLEQMQAQATSRSVSSQTGTGLRAI